MTEGKRTWREAQAEAKLAEREAAGAGFGMPIFEVDIPDPVEAARHATARGDRLLQVVIPLGWSQGFIGIGSHATRYRAQTSEDLLGQVEAEGWELQHVASSFIEQGSSSTKRVLANAGSTLVAGHGMLVGLYVFRRTDR